MTAAQGYDPSQGWRIAPPLLPSGEPVWWPVNAMQQAAYFSPAQLALIGGQSGGGKTSLLAADAMKEFQNPFMRSLVLRTTFVEMQEISDQMQRMYEPLGAKWRRPSKVSRQAWVFPAGGTVTPGYLSHPKDLSKYRGNPYGALFPDESNEHAEKLIRELMSWLAPPVSHRLFVRGRFGANPGGPGQGWQMRMFLRDKCPVHYPASRDDDRPTETSVYPGKVYRGATWLSDGRPVGMTTAFFPAKLADNPFYDEQKRSALEMQVASIRTQLLDGCWCNAEGLYFKFLRPEHMVPFPTVPREWWWGHFLSHDYGYGSSAAGVGMYCIAPNGTVYKVREQVVRSLSSKNIALGVCKNGFERHEDPRMPAQECWINKIKPHDPERPRVLFALFDPANDQHHGTGRSNYEIMAAIYREYGIPTLLARHDPMSNAQNLYNGLDSRRLVITDACPYTFATLTSRTIDDRSAVKKERGNPQDDCYDETAYGWNTWLGDSVKPERVEVEEQYEKLREQGVDETSLARFRWAKEQEMRQKEEEARRGIRLTGPRIGQPIGKKR